MPTTNKPYDAYDWSYDRYIADDPELVEYFDSLDVKFKIAGAIYNIREKLNMTREQLSECSGLSPDTIEDLEETDYDGDWGEAIEKVNRGFQNWFTTVILPAARMTPEEYSVKVVVM
jgi:DNA-binding protein HU-beta